MEDWSELKTNLVFKPECVRPFFTALDRAGEVGRGFVKESGVDSDFRLYFEDPYGDWIDHRGFAVVLAPFVKEGYLRSIGDGDRQWAYYFDGRGAAYPIRFHEEIDYNQPVQMMRRRNASQVPAYLEIGLGNRGTDGSPSPVLQFRFSWQGDRKNCL